MSEQKVRSKDDEEILELAYRTVAGWLNEPLGPLSKAVPKTPDLEHITGLQLKASVEEYDREIKRFEDVLGGRIKPRVIVIEPSSENFSVQKAKWVEQERQTDREIVRKGIVILEKRRNKLWRKLQILRLKQPLVHRKLKEATQIIEEARQLNAKIMEETGKLKQMLREMESLKSKHNGLFNQFQRSNLDPSTAFPQFNVDIPQARRLLHS